MILDMSIFFGRGGGVGSQFRWSLFSRLQLGRDYDRCAYDEALYETSLCYVSFCVISVTGRDFNTGVSVISEGGRLTSPDECE
jgi:hypothetical protein